LIWDYIFPLTTLSGIRYEHLLPIGNKWQETELNMYFYPEIHLFLSHATVRALINQSNPEKESTIFLAQLISRMKEKNAEVWIHVKDNKKNPLDFSKISLPYILIKD